MPAAKPLLPRAVYLGLAVLCVFGYSAVAQNKNPWTYDRGLKESTGLCTVSSVQAGLQIQLTRQHNIDVGLTIDFAPASSPKTPQVTMTYANGQSIQYATVATGPTRLTLLPGAADGFSGPLKAADGGFKIILPQQTIDIGSAQTALLSVAMEECLGNAAPAPLQEPTPLTAAVPVVQAPQADNKTADITKEPPVAEQPAVYSSLVQRHMNEENDGGLERSLLEEWAEKMNLLEKENSALRSKMQAERGLDKLQDLRTDPMLKIREEALRRKVEQLQEEVQNARAEAQKALAEKEALIAAEPPALPPEENQAQDLPPVLQKPPEEKPPVAVSGPPPAPPQIFTVPEAPVKTQEKSTIPAITIFGPPPP